MLRRLLPLLILTVTVRAQSRFVADAANTPVKWTGWSAPAVERASRENRPLFLFVGFASSFECFRMQREVFVDPAVAGVLNSTFVPLLLDRLEYPEVAETYEGLARSNANVQGWPLLMILAPSLEPFAIAGPLPAGELKQFLSDAAARWARERDSVSAEAHQNVMRMRAQIARVAGPAERRPNAMTISLLARTKQTGAASDALRKLAASALHDSLGGGFHRAARDDAWKQPYFEKMLSDQALFAIAALETWQSTRDPEMEQVVRTTLDAALRDMHPQNRAAAFDASQHAHSLVPAQGPEFWNGAFYVWDKEEVVRLVGPEGALKIARAFGMSGHARNILRVEDPVSLKDPAIGPLLAKMLDLRQKRPQPFRETNVISGLNGLMISALARAGGALGERKYVDAATGAALAVTRTLWNPQKKTLAHSAGVEATADDYAMLVQGLLDLFGAGHDPAWLELAMTLQQRQDQLFWNETEGRYVTGTSLPMILTGLIVEREDEVPAANSVAAMNLVRLALLTGNDTWRAHVPRIFERFGENAQLPQLAAARAASGSAGKIVVVVGDGRKPARDAVQAEQARFEPLGFVLLVPMKGAVRDRMVRDLPFMAALAGDREHPETPVLYECSGGECRRR